MPSRHITKSGRERWRAQLLDGAKRVSLGLFDRYEDALVVEEAARARQRENPRTVGMWVTEFMKMREEEGLHRNAWRYHAVANRIHADPIAERPLRGLTEPDVRAFVRRLVRTPAKAGKGHKGEPGRTLSRSAVAQTLTLLRQALERAVEEGACSSNASRLVKVPKMARTTEGWDWLRADEVEALLSLDRSEDKRIPEDRPAIYTVAVLAGLRAGELWGLRWGDVVLGGARPELVVRHSYRDGATKSGKVRRVPLLPRAIKVLKAWKKTQPGVGGALVFPADGGGCHAQGFTAGLAAALKGAGVRRVRFHDLRHTCASHLLQGTWTARPLRLEEVQQWLGHSTITVTERYAHLCPGGLHDAIQRPVGEVIQLPKSDGEK